tara:strand:+ start:4241 stop:4909 length:669 start_codon:yes stop_codon:yes gene_type:complete
MITASICSAKTIEVSLSGKTTFQAGNTYKLRGADFSVDVGTDPGSKCAVPGFNCGAGYIPPHPTFKISCGSSKPCPYVVITNAKDATSGILSFENEASCEQSKSEQCFREFSKQYKSDEGCMKMSSPLGQYYCLERFPKSQRPENRSLCNKLPAEIYGLRWNCYYDYAIRYKDPSFCELYPEAESSGKERCWLKMADLMKDKSLCKKISKEALYVEQCQALK